MTPIAEQLAQELNVKTNQVNAAITLLDDGATVPFIARYRKEATDGLDDNHLRQLAQRLSYLRELNERRQVIITNIEQQGQLTPELKSQLLQADNKTRLEDLYLPYRPKRRTKGLMAIEAGLAPLADELFSNHALQPEQAASAYLNPSAGYENVEQVLEGVSYILIERFGEDADLLQKLRRHLQKQAHLVSRVVKKHQQEASKYQDYFDHSELLSTVPSHRALAMLRGRNEGYLSLSLAVDPGQEDNAYSSAEQIITDHFNLRLSGQAAASFLTKVVIMAWKIKLSTSLETELLGQLRERAEREAINVFATNLKDLLMAAPAGAKVTLGLDPGLRTGCKLAIVDSTSKLVHTATIFPHAPQNHWDKSVRTLVNLCQQYKVELIAIGNGTASRESDKLVAEVLAKCSDLSIKKVMVSEAGASVYSASELAANEFPELDVSLRGAVSIARRLQDPLAELVKIDPKAIGVGQYQHDVSQSQLVAMLDNVIEDCVNAVGVDLNSASPALLMRVSGLTKTMAQNIVTYREQQGRFNNRNELKKVARLGPKAFEQAAGFLRIANGENPLDQSGVHPETYPVVKRILNALGCELSQVIGQSNTLNQLEIKQVTDEQFGEVTVKDIVRELEKPGRDPRPEFKTANFKEGVNTINDLQLGMVLEGVISNVANFGAFVDLGVHQDGLVHISAMTDKFISDPHDFVKAGDIVTVKVTEVDVARKRISLTMRLDDKVQPSASTSKHQPNKAVTKQKPTKHAAKKPKNKVKDPANAVMGNAFADAFAKLKK
ncbi:Tex family protein [Thalassotalea sp. G2M2-11]|uniref:Tex family protein n=1 Tax=Thalassotalea sp. G2M2-11 TaxID=2787627 RepID=UPI0019D0E148|nr:Tex family protein [Thalassotalea sp. G2M2-11]